MPSGWMPDARHDRRTAFLFDPRYDAQRGRDLGEAREHASYDAPALAPAARGRARLTPARARSDRACDETRHGGV